MPRVSVANAPAEQLPVVSVIVPCRKIRPALFQQLESLSLQREAPPFEILLCDNGGNESLIGEVCSRFNVRVLDARAETGTAAARNVGILAARAETLLFCDADDVVGPTWVADGFAELKRVPVFSGGAVPFSSAELNAELPDIWDELCARLQDYVQGAADHHLAEYPILLGCSFGMWRTLALRLGGFDRRFRSQGEDNDLAFRVKRELGGLPRAPHVAVAYRVRPAGDVGFRRAFRAGYRHSAVCARHDAWSVSPSYSGHWILRPIREHFTSAPASRAVADGGGRLLGLMVGRVRYRVAPPRPARLLDPAS